MGLQEIVLGLVSIVVTMLSWFFMRLQATMDKLEDNVNSCQNTLPVKYVLKGDYKDEMHEIKGMLKDISAILREQGKK